MEYEVRLIIAEFIEANKLSAAQVVAYTQGRLSARTVYALTKNESRRLNLRSLEQLARALDKLTGRPVSINDLLVMNRISGPSFRVLTSKSPAASENLSERRLRQPLSNDPSLSLTQAARIVGVERIEILQAIKWYKTLQATEVKPGKYVISEKALADWQELRRKGRHQTKSSPLRISGKMIQR